MVRLFASVLQVREVSVMYKLKGLTKEQTRELIPKNLIFLGYRGSIAHGMYIPPEDPNSIDDKDLIGVYFLPKEHYLGFTSKRAETREKFIVCYDALFYEFRKFVRLLAGSNPNVLGTLWLDDKYVLYKSDIWETLLSKRDNFVSLEAYKSFTGYAYGQLKRMTASSCEGYMGEKRKRLVEKYGYDCKNAAHLIRILKMGIEFFKEGRLNVERYDAPFLLEIKRGKYSLEYVQNKAEELFALADKTYAESKLPKTVNSGEIEKFVVSVLEKWIVSTNPS